MRSTSEIYADIRAMVAHIDRFAAPEFHKRLQRRSAATVPATLTPSEELRRIAIVFAYSGGVQATPVTRMIEDGHYDKAFAGFDVRTVAALNPCDIYDQHFHSIRPLKNENKLLWLVRVARVLGKGHSVVALMVKHKVPAVIRSASDIDAFWSGLKKVEKELKKLHFSGIQSVTSQLHFLLELGYDCVKPDRIVMDVAIALGIINAGRGSKTDRYSEANLLAVARFMQECALELGVRPGILDLYFLIQGKHTDADLWPTPDFTPWKPEPSLHLAA